MPDYRYANVLNLAKAELPKDRDLAGWAAHDAARILRDNWGAAFIDGVSPSQLLADVDETCARLMQWKAVMAELLKE